MEFKDLENLYREIDNEFGTLVKVDIENTDSSNKVKLHFKAFKPDKEEYLIELESRLSDIQDELSEYAGTNQAMIEIFQVLANFKHDQLDPADLVFLSKFLSSRTRLQLFFIPSESSVYVVLRSFVPIVEDREKLKNELLLTLKDFLSYHYSIKFEQIVGSIYDTIDDKKMIESLVSKHKSAIKSLLDPERADDF